MIKHKHHIIPKHMGGTDDPSNLVKLTVEEHADAHRKLYEQYGKWEDLYAWQGLLGLIPKQELVRKIQIEAGKKRNMLHGNPFTGVRTEYNFDVNSEFQKRCTELSKTPEALAKKREKFRQIGHQQGEKNSQYGKCWITHEKFGNKKISIEDVDKFLSLGYTKGRKMIVN